MLEPHPIIGLLGLTFALLLASEAQASGRKATVSPPGALDKDEIREVVRANIDQIRRCYNQELTRDPDSAGRIIVNFVIESTGRVGRVDIEESVFPVDLNTCMVNAIASWTFPPQIGRASCRER